jgi:hypothetical protein
MLYNPWKKKLPRTIKVPLYYSGLTSAVSIREKEGKKRLLHMNRSYEIDHVIYNRAESYTWFVIE